MKHLKTRARVALLSACSALLFCACPGDDKQAADPAGSDGEASATLVCPPCGMQMPADSELTVVGDHQFAFCNDRCREIVSAAPEKFLAHGLPLEGAESAGSEE